MPKKASAARRVFPKAKPSKPKKAAPKSKTKAVARKAGPAPRADYGAPIDGFIAKQPAHLRAILEALRKMVKEAAPDASSALKWGMPFFMLGAETVCALGGHKAHVNLILPGPPGTYADPDGLLSGDGKTGRRLVIKHLDELRKDVVRSWLRTAASRARKSS
jgi:hypothetical protein